MSCHPFSYLNFKKEITPGYSFLSFDPDAKNPKTGVWHPGYDYNKNNGKGANGDLNEPIHSCKRGIVRYAKDTKGGYGLLTVLEHEDGTYSKYAHQNKILVQVGQMVEEGEVIGLAGKSGTSSVHCHHELLTAKLVEYLKKLRPNNWYTFYPNGKSKAWVSENYINPLTAHTYSPPQAEIKKNMIKISVLCGQPHDFDLVVNDFAAHEIDIEVTSQVIQTELYWKGDMVDKQKLMYDYGSYANGCDIFVVMTYDWHSPLQGYTDPEKVGLRENLFGFEYIFIDETGEVYNPNETFKYEDPRLRSFAHELFHAFKKMAGQPDLLDNGEYVVHQLNDRGALFKEHGIDFSKIQTRNKEDFYRLYKKTNTIIEHKVTKDMVGWFKSGLLYWYLFGFRQSL